MSIVLQSNRLRVEIADPNVLRDTPTRFDRAAFITQVTLDGQHTFCGREPDSLPHPPTNGVGLCSEFRCNDAVEAAALGEQFVKFGVGLLTKDLDGRYVHFHTYPCEPFAVSVHASEAMAQYVTQPRACNGFAARTTRRLEVAGNELLATITLENVGERHLSVQEYCHNFVTLDRQALGPGYYLAMNVSDQTNKPAQGGIALCGEGRGVDVVAYSNEPSMFIVARMAIATPPAPFRWQLTHSDIAGVGAEDGLGHAGAHHGVGLTTSISPEIICQFEAAPGESVSWTRKWTFEG